MADKSRMVTAAAIGAVIVVLAIAMIVLGRRSRGDRTADRIADARAVPPAADVEPPVHDQHAEARRRADGLRAQIHALSPRSKLDASANRAEQPLDRYVQAIAHDEFLPMAHACYGDLSTQKPDARGKVALHVVVVGHPAVGGVVDSVQLDSGSTLDDPQLTTCLVESMLALSFGAPPDGQERVEFVYPFEFPDSKARD